MYSLPSTSQIREPSARSTKNGSRPRPRKARTGEMTPPGMRPKAAAKSWEEGEGMQGENVERPTPNVQHRILEPARPRAGESTTFSQTVPRLREQAVSNSGFRRSVDTTIR